MNASIFPYIWFDLVWIGLYVINFLWVILCWNSINPLMFDYNHDYLFILIQINLHPYAYMYIYTIHICIYIYSYRSAHTWIHLHYCSPTCVPWYGAFKLAFRYFWISLQLFLPPLLSMLPNFGCQLPIKLCVDGRDCGLQWLSLMSLENGHQKIFMIK